MDRRTAEWFEFLARALVWGGVAVLVLAVIGAIQVATSDSAIPFFQQAVERESRAIAGIGILAAGITAAGVLAALGAILRLLLIRDEARVTEHEALKDPEDSAEGDAEPRREAGSG
jgi:hypothetical protein